MKITRTWLTEKDACTEGVEWFSERKFKTDRSVIEALIADSKHDWANWAIVRLMKRKQYLAYAIFSAEQVLDIFEKEYPNDKRPRMLIEAARAVLQNDSAKNRAAAMAAWASAGEASGEVAWEAAGDAAWEAARDAAWASARASARAAAWAASGAASGASAKKEMQERILKHGFELMEWR